MGELSKSVHRNNGAVLGIIPKHLLEIEGINKNYGETIITEDMAFVTDISGVCNEGVTLQTT